MVCPVDVWMDVVAEFSDGVDGKVQGTALSLHFTRAASVHVHVCFVPPCITRFAPTIEKQTHTHTHTHTHKWPCGDDYGSRIDGLCQTNQHEQTSDVRLLLLLWQRLPRLQDLTTLRVRGVSMHGDRSDQNKEETQKDEKKEEGRRGKKKKQKNTTHDAALNAPVGH